MSQTSMPYQLTITIDQRGLTNIYGAGQAVAVAKSTFAIVAGKTPSASTNSPIVWLAFQPLQTNSLLWSEDYYVYATTTALQPGAVIAVNAVTSTPVQTGWLYTLQNGHFDAAAEGGVGNGYSAANQMSGRFSFGLQQQASVNGVTTAAPQNAVPVLFNQEISFTPSETLSIFLTSVLTNGTCVYQIPENALSFPITSQNSQFSIGFNDKNNTFYLM